MNVLGKNVVLFINGEPYACAVGGSINVSTSIVETSTTGSGIYSTFQPQKHSWTASLDGVVSLDSTDLTLYDLRAFQLALTIVTLTFERTDSAGNEYTTEGQGIIVGSSDTGNINDFATFTVELQGTGALTELFNIEPILSTEDNNNLITEDGDLIITEN